MIKPLFFSPVFQERIWGGEKLKSVFQYEIPTNQIGECWAISAHPNGQSVVREGAFKGKTLGELWEEDRELFGHLKGDKFPLLIKILDANDDLSVQVHPDDTYAHVNENGELGKTECWYIIDCDDEAELIFGHHAQSKEELTQMLDHGKWNDLLRRIKIKKGDFFYVPSGTVHALCKGTLVLETQQNSDTTYRLYDYDRRDALGNLRALHLDKSKEVITVPFTEQSFEPQIQVEEGFRVTKFVESEYFSVYKWEVKGEATLNQNQPFLLCSVIDGKGSLIQNEVSYPLVKGSHFLLPYGFGEIQMKGHMELIVSHV